MAGMVFIAARQGEFGVSGELRSGSPVPPARFPSRWG